MGFAFPLLVKFYKADHCGRDTAPEGGTEGGQASGGSGRGPPGVAERAAAGGDAGLGGAAAAGRGCSPRGAAQFLLAPRGPKAIGEPCNTGARGPELSSPRQVPAPPPSLNRGQRQTIAPCPPQHPARSEHGDRGTGGTERRRRATAKSGHTGLQKVLLKTGPIKARRASRDSFLDGQRLPTEAPSLGGDPRGVGGGEPRASGGSASPCLRKTFFQNKALAGPPKNAHDLLKSKTSVSFTWAPCVQTPPKPPAPRHTGEDAPPGGQNPPAAQQANGFTLAPEKCFNRGKSQSQTTHPAPEKCDASRRQEGHPRSEGAASCRLCPVLPGPARPLWVRRLQGRRVFSPEKNPTPCASKFFKSIFSKNF